MRNYIKYKNVPPIYKTTYLFFVVFLYGQGLFLESVCSLPCVGQATAYF